MTLLKVNNLKKYFPIRKGILRRYIGDIKAVDDISFSIDEGEIIGLVGESGSGKSTAARALARLIEPTEGKVFFRGQNILTMKKKALRQIRLEIQMIFQDPLASLNPRKTIVENIGESLFYHKIVKSKEEQVEKVLKILNLVGLSESALTQYPHQFSGGQQQRISIGRAIALRPKLVICDEAVSALDLSVQAQILNLLYDLKKKLGFSYLFISHDLSVVRNFCDKVIVLYRGKIVERGSAKEVFEDPKHPYTKTLLSAIP